MYVFTPINIFSAQGEEEVQWTSVLRPVSLVGPVVEYSSMQLQLQLLLGSPITAGAGVYRHRNT
jgi:hypothetical protein